MHFNLVVQWSYHGESYPIQSNCNRNLSALPFDPRALSAYRQCLSTRRDKAIFSPDDVHTGEIKATLAKSAFTAITLPPVDVEPMFTINTSPLVNGATFACCPPACDLTPSKRRSKKKLISICVNTSGNWWTAPSTCPTNLSALQSVGSILVPTPINPPGTAYCKSFVSAKSDTTLEKIGVHFTFPSWSLETIPGRTSISSPTCRQSGQ